MDINSVEKYLREIYNFYPQLKLHYYKVLSECAYVVQFQRKISSEAIETQHMRMNEYINWEKKHLRSKKIKKICSKLDK
jgi:hypothetical protein